MDEDANVHKGGWTASRLCLGALLLLLGGCVYFSRHTLAGACSDDLDSPIRNFCVVAPGILWRGERPTTADAKWLLEHRVGTVVSLQLDDERAFEALAPARGFTHTIDYFHVSGFDPIEIVIHSGLDSHVAHFLAILREAPKPVYVHCRAGVDRTGVVAAAYRVLIEGVNPEQAIAEMGRFHSPWQRFDARYIRSLSGARRTELLDKVAGWESELQPNARIECLQGRCTYVRAPEEAGKASASLGRGASQ